MDFVLEDDGFNTENDEFWHNKLIHHVMDFALDNDGFCAKMMNSAVNASLGLGMSSAPAGIYDYESARYLPRSELQS